MDSHGDPDLALDGVLRGAEEALDAQVLLDPLEEQLHLLAALVERTARWDRPTAWLSLGMSPSVTEIIAALTPQQIRVIATRESQAIRVRWADDAPLWRDILLAAIAGDQKKLAALHLHAKFLLCSELAQLRD